MKTFSNLKLITTANFNGFILSAFLVDVVAMPMPMTFMITAGDDINSYLQHAIQYKVRLLSLYTPKLFELISCPAFKEAEDLNFVHMIIVAGAFLSPSMYQRVEDEFRKKTTPSNTLFIKKYLKLF